MSLVWAAAAVGWVLVLAVGAAGLRAAVRNRHA